MRQSVKCGSPISVQNGRLLRSSQVLGVGEVVGSGCAFFVFDQIVDAYVLNSKFAHSYRFATFPTRAKIHFFQLSDDVYSVGGPADLVEGVGRNEVVLR